jgi:hypothetical protein
MRVATDKRGMLRFDIKIPYRILWSKNLARSSGWLRMGNGDKPMAETELLNRMYHAILEWFVEHGRAPHYVELAHRLDLAAEETRRTLRELVDMGLPGVWQHPSTDYIESFAPFANLPTQYLITVRRRQRWYGQ